MSRNDLLTVNTIRVLSAEAIQKASRGLAKAHPQEAIDGERIWCAHASQYHHEELEDSITTG